MYENNCFAGRELINTVGYRNYVDKPQGQRTELVQITSGWAKGMVLKSPEGLSTRPTSAKIRAAVMNMLGGCLEDARVLDLCAGSGALSFEALSRGADSALLVDQEAKALKALRENAALLSKRAKSQGLPMPKVEVRGGDIRSLKKLVRGDRAFHIVFFDPPYKEALPLLRDILPEVSGLMAEDGLFICECAKESQAELIKLFQECSKYFTIDSERTYGDTAITVAQRTSEEGGA